MYFGIEGSASAAVAAAIQRKFSQEAGSASHSSSRSGSLSELSGFHGEDRDLPDQSPRKFTKQVYLYHYNITKEKHQHFPYKYLRNGVLCESSSVCQKAIGRKFKLF